MHAMRYNVYQKNPKVLENIVKHRTFCQGIEMLQKLVRRSWDVMGMMVMPLVALRAEELHTRKLSDGFNLI